MLLGIDLAWGSRAHSGVAALSSTGQLLSSGRIGADDEIIAFVRAHASGPLVAAFDAPLVVHNRTGRRPCEAEVQRRYGRRGAVAYPCNLGNPLFAQGPRAARICGQLDIDLSIWSTGHRRAIEVYPHAAMVVLFGLDRVIPYKAKTGRDLEQLRAAFAVLTALMEEQLPELGLADNPRWRMLRQRCHAAPRKADLKAAEDEIDAIFCAYLAYLWCRDGRAGNDVLGDDASGCIVVPRRQDLPPL